MKPSLNVQRLEIVVAALGSLAESMVFTGGAVVELYGQTKARLAPRVTRDIDSIVAAATRSDYQKIEAELHALGFVNAGLAGVPGPTCRYVLGDILFDVMPDTETILGFSNRWFHHALENPFRFELPSGRAVRLATFTRFLAIKFETFFARATGDIRGSHDLEDLVRLLLMRSDPVAEVRDDTAEVRDFVCECARSLLAREIAREALKGAEPPGLRPPMDAHEILTIIAGLA